MNSPTCQIAGVDGCKNGWVVLMTNLNNPNLVLHKVEDFAQVVTLTSECAMVTVDMPIGLLTTGESGGRVCDKLARSILKSPRASSIFTPPIRAAVYAQSDADARRVNKDSCGLSLSTQTLAIMPRIRDVDRSMSPGLQVRVKEIHPELCFFELNGRKSILESKKSPLGFEKRCQLLQAVGYSDAPKLAQAKLPKGVGRDDVLDAAAAVWTAKRIVNGSAIRIPSGSDETHCDENGLYMEMWR